MNAPDNELRGALFRENDKKTEKHPDYTGKITVGGQEYRLAGWISESKSGRKYLSLRASIPQQKNGGNGSGDGDPGAGF